MIIVIIAVDMINIMMIMNMMNNVITPLLLSSVVFKYIPLISLTKRYSGESVI